MDNIYSPKQILQILLFIQVRNNSNNKEEKTTTTKCTGTYISRHSTHIRPLATIPPFDLFEEEKKEGKEEKKFCILF